MKKILKKIAIIIMIICLIISLKVMSKIIINNRFIANYPDASQEFRLVLLSTLNLYEPYIAHYNYGNYFYQKGKYEEAYEKYQKALSYEIPKKRICMVRINVSLALIKMAEGKDKETSLELLKEAKEHLSICLSLTPDDEEENNGNDGNSEEQSRSSSRRRWQR